MVQSSYFHSGKLPCLTYHQEAMNVFTRNYCLCKEIQKLQQEVNAVSMEQHHKIRAFFSDDLGCLSLESSRLLDIRISFSLHCKFHSEKYAIHLSFWYLVCFSYMSEKCRDKESKNIENLRNQRTLVQVLFKFRDRYWQTPAQQEPKSCPKN